MASRVNTKFVIGLITVLVVVVGLGGVYLFVIRPDTTKLIQRGDQYLAQGLTDKALDQYGRAIKKRPDDVGLLMRYAQVLEQAKTSDPRTARKYLRQLLSALHQTLTQEPNHAEAFEKLMGVYLRLARDLGDFESWKRMHDEADGKLKGQAASETTVLAQKYRGIAQVNRMEGLDLTQEERDQARDDLLAAIEQFPEDRDVSYYLAAWYVLNARALERDPNADFQQEADEQYEKADQLSRESLASRPDDPRRQIDRLRMLGLLDRSDQQEAIDLSQQIEKQLSDNPTSLRMILELVELLPGVGRNRVEGEAPDPSWAVSGLVRAEALLRSAGEANPSEPRFVAALGRVLELQQRHDEAKVFYKQAFELQPSTNIFEGVQLDRLRASATVKYVGLVLKPIDSMTQPQKQAAIEESDALMSQVVANYGESSGEVNLALGKIAMARGQWGQASERLDRANSQFKGTNPEVLLLAAKSWVQMGELGAATDRLERLVQIKPKYMPARYELINLYIGLDQLRNAQSQVNRILRENPRDTRALRLNADLLAQRGQTEQAIDAYLRLNPQQNTELIPKLAGLYIATGQTDTARGLLESRFEQDTTNIKLLQDLIRLSQDAKQAIGYIHAAREAGADPKALEILESQFSGKAELAQVLEGLIDKDATPFDQHMKRFNLYYRLGRIDEAMGELDQAAKLKPEHPMVITGQFEQALRGRQWDRAQALAGQAATANLDMAEGMFFYGRLASQRGQYEEAIANYRRGLSLREIYSEGWRQLGDVQRRVSAWEEAAASYRRAIDQRPNNIAALTGLAVVQNALGKHVQSLETYRKALRFSPRNRALREQYLMNERLYGDPQKVLKWRQKIAAEDPDDLANRRQMILLLAQEDRLEDAQRLADALIQQAGADRENTRTAATVRSLAGDTDAAQKMIQDYVHGLKDEAVDEDWMMLARFLLDVGQDDQAMAAYRRAVEIEDPKLRRATREFADFLFEQGQYAEAVERYEHLWESNPEDQRVGYRYVEALLRLNEPERAKQVLASVTKQHGVSGNTHVLKAMISRAHGDTESALASLNEAAQLEPNRAVIYYQRSDLQASDPRLETQVMDDLRHALELDPDLSAARRLLATVHVRRGERSEAVRELVTLIKRNPRHIAARLQLVGLYQDTGQMGPRRTLLAESAKRFPKAAIWPQLQAQQALLDGDESLAIRKLAEAFALVPSPQTLGELAALLIRMDKAQEALDLLRAHGEIVRHVPLLHALRGRALVLLEQDDLANRAFTRAVERCDSFKQIAAVGIQMTQAMGREKAITRLDALSQTLSQNRSLVELGVIQLEAEAKKYDQAIGRLRRIDVSIPDTSPQRVQFNRLLALVLHQQGQHEQALGVYEQMLKSQPNNLITLNNAAYLLAEDLNRADEALPLARRAADLAPENPLVLDTLGWSLFKSGQAQSALTVLRRSVRITPSSLNSLHLGDVLQDTGDSRAAIEMYTQAKQLAEESNDQENLLLANKRLDQLTATRVGP